MMGQEGGWDQGPAALSRNGVSVAFGVLGRHISPFQQCPLRKPHLESLRHGAGAIELAREIAGNPAPLKQGMLAPRLPPQIGDLGRPLLVALRFYRMAPTSQRAGTIEVTYGEITEAGRKAIEATQEAR